MSKQARIQIFFKENEGEGGGLYVYLVDTKLVLYIIVIGSLLMLLINVVGKGAN